LNKTKKVFIVDDDAASVSSMRQFLEEKGYAVLNTSDGEQALNAIKEAIPDIIILDIIMPKIDGFTIAKQIRYDEATKKIPIIIFSISDAMKELFAIEGINDYLVKPVDNEKLLELIKSKIGE